MFNSSRKVTSAYFEAESVVDFEDKPRLLLKIYEVIVKKLDLVDIANREKDFARKFTELSKIERMVEILHSSLDRSYGELTENLSSLYLYVLKNLRSLHLDFSEAKLKECKHIISSLLDGFKKAYEIEKKGKGEAPQAKIGERRV